MEGRANDLIWGLHRKGMRVGEIARKTQASPSEVRLAIVERWAEDKEEASLRRKPGSGKGGVR